MRVEIKIENSSAVPAQEQQQKAGKKCSEKSWHGVAVVALVILTGALTYLLITSPPQVACANTEAERYIESIGQCAWNSTQNVSQAAKNMCIEQSLRIAQKVWECVGPSYWETW